MENSFLNEYAVLTSDPTFRLTAERLAFKCGIRADLKGYKFLIDAIILYGTEACTSFCEIYRVIGLLRRLNPKSVMRAISYAIRQSFGVADSLSKLVGTKIPETDIHSGLVIAYLGRLFKNPDLSVYG